DGIRDIGVTGVQTCALPILFWRFWFMEKRPLLSKEKSSHPCLRRATPPSSWLGALPKWVHLDSNQGPAGYEPDALTAELWTRGRAPLQGESAVYHSRASSPGGSSAGWNSFQVRARSLAIPAVRRGSAAGRLPHASHRSRLSRGSPRPVSGGVARKPASRRPKISAGSSESWARAMRALPRLIMATRAR